MRYLAGKERAVELVPHLSEGGFLAVVGDRQVLHAEARGPGARIDLGSAVRYQCRPEETTIRINPRVEVVQLVREVRGRRPLENVESDEPDGGVLVAAGEVDVLALHDPHVRAKGQATERALPHAAGVSRRDAAIEVENRRGIAVAEEIEVEVRTEDVRGARHRFGSAGSAPGGCDQRKPGSSECDSADARGRAGDKRPA